MVLIPSMLSQKFRIQSSWLQWLLSLRRLLTDGILRSAKWLRSRGSTRGLGAGMHSVRESLDLLKHEFCGGSLGSDLLMLQLKLLLDLVVAG